MMLYALMALLDPYNALLNVHKYTVHSALLVDFITLFFPKRPAQIQTVPYSFPHVSAHWPILKL